MANVLDLNDDFLLFNITGMKINTGCTAAISTAANHLDTWPTDPDRIENRSGPEEDTDCVRQTPAAGQAEQTAAADGATAVPLLGTDATAAAAECSLLMDVLREVRFLTKRVDSEGVRLEICNEWKFAAMVIDRVCLWMFTLFTVISTGAILCSAPHAIH